MANFEYSAVNAQGQTISGTVTAGTRAEAVKNLRDQGDRPLTVKEVKSKSLLNMSFGKGKVKQKDLVIFTRELATMINAGVPLPRSLNTMATQFDDKNFKDIIASVNKDVESGMPLGDSMAKFPQAFSDVYVNMVRAGEAGGILDEILKRLATQVEKDASIRKKIKSAMTYPVVILTVTIIAFFGIMLFIIPKIGKIFKDLGGPNAQLPVYTRVMLNISNFMVHHIIFMLIGAVVIVFCVRRYLHSEKGRFRWHGLLLKLPIMGTIVTKIAVARFSRTFSSLMGAGVSVLDSLEVTGRAVGNKVIQKEIEGIAESVKNGQSLGKEMLNSKYFPPIVGQMMSVGEETGKMDEVLVKVADFYEEEVDVVIDGLASIIEPLMIIVLGSLVGMIAASVMGPIANLSKNIGS
ncbi:MAG TPA: type II secretion system F family protein [Candidatus Saccharimonadales bacterium]|nr:type II secretion system F family protein [Candidatus Saccharimonadales bacterium]